MAAFLLASLMGALAVMAQDAKPAIPPDSTYVRSKTCAGCHKDQLKLWGATLHAKQEPPAGTAEPWIYVTGWDPATKQPAEAGVACEACHGRGKAHVTAEKDERKLKIIKGGALGSPALDVSICAQCHARYTSKEGDPPVAFTPGDDLLAKINLLPVQDGQKMQQVNELVGSRHFEKGTVCMTCHSAHTDAGVEHQLRKPVVELCGGCHADQANDLAAHTKGQAKADDTCVMCHMPNGSHAFQKPASQ